MAIDKLAWSAACTAIWLFLVLIVFGAEMETGDWISLLMVSIATASAAITYTLYRSATDPEVIVYADPDRKRPSIMNLIIKNIGNGPASDITFKLDRQLPNKAFGIEVPDKMPDMMSGGPLIVGIPYLAPGQELVLTWGQYGGLKKYMGNKPITVTSMYKRSRTTTLRAKLLVSISQLDIETFATTDSSDHNWGPKIVNGLDELNKTLNRTNNSIAKMTKPKGS